MTRTCSDSNATGTSGGYDLNASVLVLLAVILYTICSPIRYVHSCYYRRLFFFFSLFFPFLLRYIAPTEGTMFVCLFSVEYFKRLTDVFRVEGIKRGTDS